MFVSFSAFVSLPVSDCAYVSLSLCIIAQLFCFCFFICLHAHFSSSLLPPTIAPPLPSSSSFLLSVVSQKPLLRAHCIPIMQRLPRRRRHLINEMVFSKYRYYVATIVVVDFISLSLSVSLCLCLSVSLSLSLSLASRVLPYKAS